MSVRAWVFRDEEYVRLERGESVERIYRGSCPASVVTVIPQSARPTEDGTWGQSVQARVSVTTRQYGKGRKRPRYEHVATFTKEAGK